MLGIFDPDTSEVRGCVSDCVCFKGLVNSSFERLSNRPLRCHLYRSVP